MFRIALLFVFLLATNNLFGQKNFKKTDLVQLKKNLKNSTAIRDKVEAQL
jgi:hypothetical protein